MQVGARSVERGQSLFFSRLPLRQSPHANRRTVGSPVKMAVKGPVQRTAKKEQAIRRYLTVKK
ncbi:MAG TPA: hypothetical protein VIG60_03160 [Savagea sp.]